MIRSRRTGLATALFSVLTFGAGLALAGDAPLGRIDGEFFLEDADEPDLGGGFVEIEDAEFGADVSVTGVGTDGDAVEIFFFTPTPTKANADDKQGRVRQSSFSSILFTIDSEVPERDLELPVTPEKCAIDGKVNVPKDEGQITAYCSGTNIYSEISASQEASIQAAFAGTKKVKIKISSDGSKGSVQVRLKGPLSLTK